MILGGVLLKKIYFVFVFLMRVSVGSDHAGFLLKRQILVMLCNWGHDVFDFGTNDGQEPADYPDFAHAVSAHVANQDSGFGILVCNSGVGMSIAANRHKNIRAALCHNQDYAKLAKIVPWSIPRLQNGSPDGSQESPDGSQNP